MSYLRERKEEDVRAFAILNVYAEILKGKPNQQQSACLHPNDIEWIRSLECYVQETN